MPYADVEKRRRFQQKYKRAWRRRQQAKINPLCAFKIYICLKFPFLRVGRVQFDNGFLITDDIETQIQIEQLPEFAKFVFPLALDLDLISPLMDHGDEE